VLKINVRGGEHTVRVDGQGMFTADVDGRTYTADTLAGLRDQVRLAEGGIQVAVPFAVAESGVLRNGVARSVRRTDGAVHVTWEDTGRDGVLTWEQTPLRRMSDEEAHEYQRLLDARLAAQRELNRFEDSRRIFLTAAIDEARRQALESVDTEKDKG